MVGDGETGAGADPTWKVRLVWWNVELPMAVTVIV